MGEGIGFAALCISIAAYNITKMVIAYKLRVKGIDKERTPIE